MQLYPKLFLFILPNIEIINSGNETNNMIKMIFYSYTKISSSCLIAHSNNDCVKYLLYIWMQAKNEVCTIVINNFIGRLKWFLVIDLKIIGRIMLTIIIFPGQKSK